MWPDKTEYTERLLLENSIDEQLLVELAKQAEERKYLRATELLDPVPARRLRRLAARKSSKKYHKGKRK